nr:hypothetical protein [Planctomycetota bacterium]
MSAPAVKRRSSAPRWQTVRDGAVTHLHDTAPIGWRGLTPRAVLADGPEDYAFCRVRLRTRMSGSGLMAQCEITNTGTEPLSVRMIRWVSDISALYPPPTLRFPKSLEPSYFSTENFRGDYFATTTTRGEHFFKPLPHETVLIGCSEDAVFPGLFIGSGTEPVGLFCAAASRDCFHTVFRLYGGDGVETWNFEIEELPSGQAHLIVAPGATIRGERIFFDAVPTADPQQATGLYYAALRADGVFDRLRDNPLAKSRIWCSWNFGYYAKIDETEVLKQLPILRAHFPMVTFVQVDDGYQDVYPSGQHRQIDLLYGSETGYNPKSFPHGPRDLVQKIKAAGLRPATWIGFWCSGSSPMLRDHPDWVLLDDMGRPFTYRSSFAGGGDGMDLRVLDPSVPAVRAYVEHLCATVFGVWGFEGVKLDFFTFAFQSRRVRYRYPGKTAPFYQRWLVDTFRKHLPKDGFLGLCSVAGTGTPFFGEGADYFRNGEDISEGEWALAKRIALWTVNTNMLLQQHPVLVNVDSIGWGPKFGETEWHSFLNLCAVTGGALEVSGDLTRVSDHRKARLSRTLALSDPRRSVRCLDLPMGRIVQPP